MTYLLSLGEICSTLRALLHDAVKRNLADGILLSGGLDTGILASIASRFVSLKAFTAALRGVPAPDVEYATLMAGKLGVRHLVHLFDMNELLEAIPVVVNVMRSFDPMEVRNSVTIYIALRLAKESGVSVLMTGDGCDELFAGYSYLLDLEGERLESELQKFSSAMTFSSVSLAENLGIRAELPYLDPELESYAMRLNTQFKIHEERGQKWGKWVLRKAFEGLLPDEVLWRVKTPIEYGSGTHTLPAKLNQMISDNEFEEEKRKYLEKDNVAIRDKEQLFYYREYRKLLGAPHPIDSRSRICPKCNSNVADRVNYCRTCGAYPI